MIIQSISLNNIRSYTHQEITFQDGINVLFGNIGSGKSTILQAIEVCLFGLKKGEGNHLLRKGSKEGNITISLQKENQSIEIQRGFKKTNTGISQSSGYIKIDNNMEELSTQELNSYIFHFFNFPISFVNKDKTLLYRFTHYTPQEQLKEILFTSNEKRLEILRKVFDLDHYKQLQTACQLTQKEYTKEILILQSKLQEIPKNSDDEIKRIQEEQKEKLQQLNMHDEQLKKLQENIKIVQENKTQLFKKEQQIDQSIQKSKELEIKKTNLEKEVVVIEDFFKTVDESINKFYIQKDTLEKDKEKLNEKLNALSSVDEKYKILQKQKDEIQDDIILSHKINLTLKNKSQLDSQLITHKNDETEVMCKIKDLDLKKIKYEKKISKKESIHNTKKELEESMKIIDEKIKIIEVEIKTLNNQKESFESITDQSVCPTCNQSIDKDHIKDHMIKINSKLDKFNNDKYEIDEELKVINSKHVKIEDEVAEIIYYETELSQLITNIELFSNQKKRHTEYVVKKENEIKEIKVFLESIEENKKTQIPIDELNKEKEKIEIEIKSLQKQKDEYNIINNQIQKINNETLKIQNEISQIQNKKEFNTKDIKRIQEELKNIQEELIDLKKFIDLKEKISEKIEKQNELEEKLNSKKELSIGKVSQLKAEINFNTIKEKELKENSNKVIKYTNEKEKAQMNKEFLQNDMQELCSIIEEALLREIHNDVSTLLNNYFLKLIDDQELEIYLRDDFSVIVEQNGFEVEIEQLSGGEKSALALSYRLALKEVIEKYFKDNTQLNYIMLDEPTDGFSQDQIQKFATILKSSNFNQIFLVSHDANLLTSAEHVFTIEKENHISKVSY